MAHSPVSRVALVAAPILVVAAGAALTSRGAVSQVQILPAFVRLQAATPGTPQTGHANVTGTMIAGQFQGAGAGVTGVNADRLDGLDSTAFLTGVPNPLNLSGSQTGAIVSGTNLSTAGASSGIRGESVAASGATYGLFGANSSTSGRAVYGIASALSGVTYGGYFENLSPLGQAVRADSAGTTGVFGRSTLATGTSYGGNFSSSSTSGRGVYALATANSGTTYGGYFTALSPDGVGAYGSGDAYGVFGTTSDGIGVWGESTEASGGAGGWFQAQGSGGIGVDGHSTSSIGGYGVRGVAYGSGGTAVYGIANASSGNTRGVHGYVSSSDGTGVFGEATNSLGYTFGGSFRAASSSGVGVYGEATANSGTTYGGRFFSESTTGVGVSGRATAGTGLTLGVYGEVASTSGRGALGWASAVSGVNYGGWFQSDSVNGRGVYGLVIATGAADVPYAVRGSCPTSTSGYAVYAVGDTGASGTKSFRIDHPFDPANKYLLHYSTESPFPQNFYSGNVTTGVDGTAWVSLPSYFSAINTNIKYQLTVVDGTDDFVMAKVSREVEGNRFQVCTSKPRVKVSWRVEADRNDERILANRPTDERLKNGDEKGTYQHPEYYGLGPELGMDARPKTGR